MIKLALKIVVFAVLFFIGLTFTDDYFKERRIGYFARENYKELNTNVDIAIFGSSHGINGIDPRFIQKELRKTAFNFSSAGQRLVTTLPVIDEILDDNDVELAIVDIFPGTVRSLRRAEKKARFFQYNTFDNIDFSLSKVIAHNRTNGFESFLQMSPTIRRHNHWINLFRDLDHRYDANSDFNNGYFSRFFFDQKIWDRKIASIDKNIDRNKPILELNNDEKSNIDAVVARFRRADIPLLFVSVPFYQDTLGKRTSSHQTLIIEYLKQQGQPVIDFNSMWDDFKFSQDEFTDAGHVNTKAAIKLSQYLAGYVEQHYDFDAETISEEKLVNNRYAIIDNDLSNILFKKKIDSGDVLFDKGYRKLYAFRAYKDKYELLFESIEDSLGTLPIRYQYTFDPSEAHMIKPNFETIVGDNGMVAQRLNGTNELRYKGKTYHVFQFSSPFTKLNNFKLFSIEGKKRKVVCSFDELILSSSSE